MEINERKSFLKKLFGGGNNMPGGMYRHEFKYLINTSQLKLLEHRLDSIMKLDPHVDETGRYQIRSLYFDDLYNTCFYEKEDGTDPREKYRIRIYNGSTDRIRLELKRKEAGKIQKKSCKMTLEQTRRLVNGGRLEWEEDMDPLLKKLYILQETKGMKPKTIVEYERVPYVNKEGNVRVTLDLDVRASSDVSSFLDKETKCRPIMPLGRQLMEVKWDEFIPDHIFRSIQIEGLTQTTFSKYYLCKKFGGLA